MKREATKYLSRYLFFLYIFHAILKSKNLVDMI